MTQKQDWVLTFTPANASGREVGRYASRDDAMLAAQDHFDRHFAQQSGGNRSSNDDDDGEELGWQMSFASATAVASVGAYRVVRGDFSRRQR